MTKQPYRKHIFFYHKQDETINEQLERLKDVAVNNDFTVVDEAKKANIIVSIGGDGAFLQTVRKTGFRQDCLYVGIALQHEIELYCDFNLENFSELLYAVQHEEEIEVRRFPLIDVSINGVASSKCLNEISVRSPIVKTIVMDIYIDDLHFETFRGDGLVVATPTGSTGYNKSTMGAIIDPKLPCFQVTELASLNNNKYRTLGSSFILSSEKKLHLEIEQGGNDFPVISFDNEAFPIRNVKEVTVGLSNQVVKTVKLKNNTYWDRVKRMFL
ncbi:NAD kinase [Virgibacillus soli]|uniref:NAD kinase n=1 Tax=Paracerasibacillus soli TaxID=480284 RepID=A0ABU5CQM7_9BACI|nr:NAD kinase [Virgibacillus soli]MDY0408673.1 NAD kinase [Virgibacillus soli]